MAAAQQVNWQATAIAAVVVSARRLPPLRLSLLRNAFSSQRSRRGTGARRACCLGMLTEKSGKTAEQIAREVVERHGADAVTLLRRRADQAKAIGEKSGQKRGLTLERWPKGC